METSLIAVADRAIGSNTVQTVNARDLHAFMGSKQDFSTWIKARIEQYGFEEEVDYLVHKIVDKVSGGRPSVDYHLSIDMAKELAMVERNEKGKQARQYFIECERKAKSNVIDISTALSDPASLRGMLLGYTEKVIELEQKLVVAAPKVAFHDAVCEAINGQTVQEVAKVIGTGQNRLFRWLRMNGMLMANNQPYQSYIDSGHFRVVERQYTDPRGESHTYTRTLITGKGLAYIQKRFGESEAA